MTNVFDYSLFLMASAIVFWIGIFIRAMASGTHFRLNERRWLRFFVRNIGRLIGVTGAFFFAMTALSMDEQGMIWRLPLSRTTVILASLSSVLITTISLLGDDMRKRWLTLGVSAGMIVFTWYLVVFISISFIKNLL